MLERDRATGRLLGWDLATAGLICWAMIACLAFLHQEQGRSVPAAKEAAAEGTKLGISFSRDIQPIFNANCVLCHQGAGPAGLGLDPGLSYVNLVGKPSSESKLPRVAPGVPPGSYLIHKLMGTQLSVGGSGAQMPHSGPPLLEPQLAMIQGWIQEGAPNN